jgi:hypothetical protein
MKVKFLSGDRNASLKKNTKSTKAKKAGEIPDQIKKRAGAFKVTNNLAYLNNRGPEVPVKYDQYIAPTRLTVYEAVPGVFQVRNFDGTITLNTLGQIVSNTISTSGRPVQIMACGDMNPQVTLAWVELQLYRDSTPIGNTVTCAPSIPNENQGYCIQVIDQPPVGTYTYYLKVVNGGIDVGSYVQFGESSGPVINAVELRN